MYVCPLYDGVTFLLLMLLAARMTGRGVVPRLLEAAFRESTWMWSPCFFGRDFPLGLCFWLGGLGDKEE